MALEIPFGIKVLNPLPVESKFFNSSGLPYVDTTEVTTEIPESIRYQGLTVFVVDTEYWFKDGVTDGDLIVKSTGGSISGSGTTNELTYWTGSSAIGSLSTATYPSLTELSYVKGLTSSAQTQITAREVLTNKATSFATLNNDLYPTTQSLFQQRSVTATDSIVAADTGKTIVFNSATPIDFTIDTLTAGVQVAFINKGVGTVTFLQGTGVTLTGTSSLATDETAAIIYYTSSTAEVFSGGGSGSYIFGNGLTESAGTVTLGSLLTGDVNFTFTTPYNFNFGSSAPSEYMGNFTIYGNRLYFRSNNVGGSAVELYSGDGNTYQTISDSGIGLATNGTIGISATDGTTYVNLEQTPSNFSSKYFFSSVTNGETYEANIENGSQGVVSKWSGDIGATGAYTLSKHGWGLGTETGIYGFHIYSNGTTYGGTPADSDLRFRIRSSGEVTLNLGSDATGDIYRRNSSGYLSRLALGSALQVLRVNSGGTDIEWAAPSGGGIGGSTGSTDNSILRADGTGGATLQSSLISLSDSSGSTVTMKLEDNTANADGLLFAITGSDATVGTNNGGTISLTAGNGFGGGSKGNIGLSGNAMVFNLANNGIFMTSTSSLEANIVGVLTGTGTFFNFVTNSGGGGTDDSASILIATGNSGTGGTSNSGHIYLDVGAKGGSGLEGNIGFFSSNIANWQSMQRGIFIANASTVPTGNPTGGGFLYVEAGALKYRGSSGTVTTIGVA